MSQHQKENQEADDSALSSAVGGVTVKYTKTNDRVIEKEQVVFKIGGKTVEGETITKSDTSKTIHSLSLEK